VSFASFPYLQLNTTIHPGFAEVSDNSLKL